MMHAVKVSNYILGEEFFIVTNSCGHLQVQDKHGNVVIPVVTYDSPSIADLLSYRDRFIKEQK